MFGFKIIRTREYDELYDLKDVLNERLKDQRKHYDERIDELYKENEKHKEEVAEKRSQLRRIHKIIKVEKGQQQYDSAINVLNRLETAIEKIEAGD